MLDGALEGGEGALPERVEVRCRLAGRNKRRLCARIEMAQPAIRVAAFGEGRDLAQPLRQPGEDGVVVARLGERRRETMTWLSWSTYNPAFTNRGEEGVRS